jgi:hypothetical protein
MRNGSVGVTTLGRDKSGETGTRFEDEMTVHCPVTLPQLARRFSEAIEAGAGIALSAEEFSLFEATGAWDLLQEAIKHERNPADFPTLSRQCAHCVRNASKWVYFIRVGDDGPVKIGITTKPQDRLWALQQASPARLQFLALFRAAQCHESELHHFYEREWLRGEWFRASPRLLAYAEHQGVVR